MHSSMPAPQNNISFFFEHVCKKRSENNFIFPPIKAPSPFLLNAIGKKMLLQIVLHHHVLLRRIASANFYAQEYQFFMEEITKIAHFMIEAFGCNNVYTNEYGLNAMNRTEKPFTMSEKEREIWLELYAQTLKDLAFPKKFLAEFWNWIEVFSLRILDTKTLKNLPQRFYFTSIKNVFG